MSRQEEIIDLVPTSNGAYITRCKDSEGRVYYVISKLYDDIFYFENETGNEIDRNKALTMDEGDYTVENVQIVETDDIEYFGVRIVIDPKCKPHMIESLRADVMDLGRDTRRIIYLSDYNQIQILA